MLSLVVSLLLDIHSNLFITTDYYVEKVSSNNIVFVMDTDIENEWDFKFSPYIEEVDFLKERDIIQMTRFTMGTETPIDDVFVPGSLKFICADSDLQKGRIIMVKNYLIMLGCVLASVADMLLLQDLTGVVIFMMIFALVLTETIKGKSIDDYEYMEGDEE